MQKPLLFTPFKMRGVVASNRAVVSPMVQYRATDGLVNDYHIVHLGKFALGKFGIVFTENCAVVPEGRVTQGDLGMWDDSQIEGHKRLTRFLQQEGALAATQITHAGRKASSPRQFDKHQQRDDQHRRNAAINRVCAVSGLGDHRHIRLVRDQRRNAGADDRMVVGGQNANRHARSKRAVSRLINNSNGEL